MPKVANKYNCDPVVLILLLFVVVIMWLLGKPLPHPHKKYTYSSDSFISAYTPTSANIKITYKHVVSPSPSWVMLTINMLHKQTVLLMSKCLLTHQLFVYFLRFRQWTPKHWNVSSWFVTCFDLVGSYSILITLWRDFFAIIHSNNTINYLAISDQSLEWRHASSSHFELISIKHKQRIKCVHFKLMTRTHVRRKQQEKVSLI